jgi:hypothetical protein
LQDIATAVQNDIDFFADAVWPLRENTSVFDLKVDCRPRPPAQIAGGRGTEKVDVDPRGRQG